MCESMMEKGEDVNKKMKEMLNDMKGLIDPANWTAARLCGMCTSLVLVVLFFVLTIMLGRYGFNNPDPEGCWVIKGIDTAALTRDAIEDKAKDMGRVVPEGYPVEMHGVYVGWALWGFWQNFIFVGVFITSMILMACNCIPMASLITSTIVSFGWIVSSTFWLILGMVWRYSSAGQISAGDRLQKTEGMSSDEWKAALENASDANGYQIRSGSFLGFVAGAISTLIFLTICFFAVLGCCMVCCGMEKLPSMDDIGKKANNYSNLPQTDEPANENRDQPTSDLVGQTKA